MTVLHLYLGTVVCGFITVSAIADGDNSKLESGKTNKHYISHKLSEKENLNLGDVLEQAIKSDDFLSIDKVAWHAAVLNKTEIQERAEALLKKKREEFIQRTCVLRTENDLVVHPGSILMGEIQISYDSAKQPKFEVSFDKKSHPDFSIFAIRKSVSDGRGRILYAVVVHPGAKLVKHDLSFSVVAKDDNTVLVNSPISLQCEVVPEQLTTEIAEAGFLTASWHFREASNFRVASVKRLLRGLVFLAESTRAVAAADPGRDLSGAQQQLATSTAAQQIADQEVRAAAEPGAAMESHLDSKELYQAWLVAVGDSHTAAASIAEKLAAIVRDELPELFKKDAQTEFPNVPFTK